MMQSVKTRVATSRFHFHLFRETRNHFYFEINSKMKGWHLKRIPLKMMPFSIVYIDWKSIELHKKN